MAGSGALGADWGDIQEGKLLEGDGRGQVSLRGQEEEYWDRGRGRKDCDLGLGEG